MKQYTSLEKFSRKNMLAYNLDAEDNEIQQCQSHDFHTNRTITL